MLGSILQSESSLLFQMPPDSTERGLPSMRPPKSGPSSGPARLQFQLQLQSPLSHFGGPRYRVVIWMKNVFGDSSGSDSEPGPLLPPPKRFKPPAETNVNYEVVNDSEVIDASSNAQGTGSDKDTDLVDLSNAKHSSIDSPSSTKDIDDYEEDLEISRVGLGAKKPVSSYNQKASLNESIINENSIGFKIMQKMGYTQGKAIGSSQNENALIEPLSIRAKPTRAGIGVVEFKPKAATDIPSESTSTFQEYLKTKHAQQHTQIIITKLKKFCLAETGEDIRFEQGSLCLEDVNPLWRDLVTPIPKVHKRTTLFGERVTDSRTVSQTNLPSADPDPDSDALEKKLRQLICFARDNFHYCPYCGIKYHDMGDLNKNCPGDTENVHQL